MASAPVLPIRGVRAGASDHGACPAIQGQFSPGADSHGARAGASGHDARPVSAMDGAAGAFGDDGRPAGAPDHDAPLGALGHDPSAQCSATAPAPGAPSWRAVWFRWLRPVARFRDVIWLTAYWQVSRSRWLSAPRMRGFGVIGVYALLAVATLCGGMVAETSGREVALRNGVITARRDFGSCGDRYAGKIRSKVVAGVFWQATVLAGLTSRMVPDHESLTEAPFTT